MATGKARALPLTSDAKRFLVIETDADIATGAEFLVAREPWEGAQHFAERAAGRFPEQADAIRRAADLYIAARYGREPEAAAPFKKAVRRLPSLRPVSPIS